MSSPAATTPPSIKVQHKTTPIKPNQATPDSTNLKSFFQNLLAKNNSNAAPGQAGGQPQQQSPSSTTPQQQQGTPNDSSKL